MRFYDFIKDKLLEIILIFFSVFSIEIILLIYNISLVVRFYVLFAPIIASFVALYLEFYKKKKFYNDLKEKLEELDQKYLISEMINNPKFEEGKILKDVMQDTGKSMLENVNK